MSMDDQLEGLWSFLWYLQIFSLNEWEEEWTWYRMSAINRFINIAFFALLLHCYLFGIVATH
jgi:hypothetical protein